ncbi:uapA, partial [Symbiodinium sp. KB8]
MKNCSVALALFFGFFVAGVSSYTAEDGTSLPYVNGDKIDQAGVFTFLWTAPLAPHGCFLTTTFNIGFYPPAFIPLLLGPPNTTFSQNNGVIAITKFGAAIASIPDAVLGGMTTFLFANVLVSGINIVGDLAADSGTGQMGRRTRFILAVSLGVSSLQLAFRQIDCTGMGGTYTAPVMATRTVTTCIGMNGNCCVQYDDSKKMWRDSLIIILKTPYCIGTLL